MRQRRENEFTIPSPLSSSSPPSCMAHRYMSNSSMTTAVLISDSASVSGRCFGLVIGYDPCHCRPLVVILRCKLELPETLHYRYSSAVNLFFPSFNNNLSGGGTNSGESHMVFSLFSLWYTISRDQQHRKLPLVKAVSGSCPLRKLPVTI